jgi:signal transduction histidine kinase
MCVLGVERFPVLVRLLTLVFLVFVIPADAAAAPKRVLIIHSFGQDFAPWSEYSKLVRAEIFRRSPQAVDVFEATLETARIPGNLDDEPFAQYLHLLFKDRPLDLVITIGAPATQFFERHRQQLFRTTPLLATGLERRLYQSSGLENDAAVLTAIDFLAAMNNILQVKPETDHIAIVLGASPLERYWAQQISVELEPLKDRVSFTWFNDLSFEDMLKQVAALSPRSAVFFGALTVDATGVPQNDGKAVQELRAASSAPVFGFEDTYFGAGLVGGPLISISDISRQVADVASRILAGETPANVQTPPVGFAPPKFDWRELQRWTIAESNLPAGSTVEFREPTIWEQHRWSVLGTLAIVLFQAAIITALLFERLRRRSAEDASRRRLIELAQMNRSMTVSTMSNSIAHELNQPLGAILNNVSAAQLLLAKDPPDLDEIREILVDIRKDDERAGDIIAHLRGFLRKDGAPVREVDINQAIADVLHIVEPEAAKRGIAIDCDRSLQDLSVRADHVHLQQVLLNLALNGMDAMDGTRNRRMVFQTLRVADREVQVAVLDTGAGIPEHQLNDIFESFVTTKQQGTGLGLSIARTIVEMYGGRIWAENRQEGGAAFRFVLPLAKAVA